MRFDRTRRALIALAALAALGSCSNGFEPLSSVGSPLDLAVESERPGAVRLSWARVDDDDVIGYAIERRANLAGPFAVIVEQLPQTNLDRITWLDTDVDAETYYGYRVYAVSRFGDRSGPSVVGGTKTPPPPGVEVSTTSIVTTADAIDPDGYEVTITGPDTVRATIGVSARRRFVPLRPGQYSVKLSGIIERCAVDGGATKTVTVTDTTAITVSLVSFSLSCRDPKRGDIRVTIGATGKNLDPSYTLDLFGEAADATLPESERLVSQSKSINLSNPTTSFTNIRPGTYQLTFGGIADNCTVQGGTERSVTVTALGITPVAFAVTCTGEDEGGGDGPYVWRNEWSLVEAPVGQRVTLKVELDLTADPVQRVQGVSARIGFDPTVLRFEEEILGQLPFVTINKNVPGELDLLATFSSGGFRTGKVKVIDLEFTVIGSVGATTRTATTNLTVADAASEAFQEKVRIEENTFTVKAGGGGTNQPPKAEANGPYTGAPSVAVSLSGAGSNDPDGTIASYAWNFGDGSTGSGQAATHAYANAGTYTATLTVTDNLGATASDQATVTITGGGGGGGGNTPPVAEANGPYTATTGVALTLSSAGSIDANGTIASYSWSLGNGQTVTGASPSVTYAAAGSYTITLTVTDNQGATATDQATVTVAAPQNTKPLIWKSVFGPVDVTTGIVAITISYDLRTNLAETPGVETLQSFVLDSLKWDSSVLQFYAINLGPNVTGTANQGQVGAGKLSMQGSVSGAQASGLITIATVRFKLVGSPGSIASTLTYLGTLQGAASTNSFVYNGKTTVTEGSITVP